jgi:ABC-type nitrate/sulfonate/bicarbonate transport system substrate-binding protein
VGSPYPQESVAAGYATYLFHAPLADVSPMSEAITQTLATTQSYYDSHQALIKQFVAGYQKGLDEWAKDPQAAAAYTYPKYFSTQDKAAFDQSYAEDLSIIAKTTTMTSAQIAALKQIATAAGVTIPADWDSYFVAP